ncbi:MAG: NADH-quinone oxidoreductase subunit B [Planctomycetota bacterium]|nr:MAG: NADH-quinone oxidoreductase subunit B [Planctomycetota bacterium]
MGIVIENLPKLLDPIPGGSKLINTVDYIANWARSNSIWPLVYGTSCCAIEMMSTGSSKHDWARFGWEVARATPRQADLIILAGTIVEKMADPLRRLYDQMPAPKYVIAMGACTISGGPFFYDNYSVVKGADHIIPVDVYIPGCPPRPEALLYGIMELQKIMCKETIRETRKKEINAVPSIDAMTVAVQEWEAELKGKEAGLKEEAKKYKEENPDYKPFKQPRKIVEKFEKVERVIHPEVGKPKTELFEKLLNQFPFLTLYDKEETNMETVEAMKADEILDFILPTDQYIPVINFVKKNADFQMDLLLVVTAVDWLDHYDVIVQLTSTTFKHKLFFRTPIPKDDDIPEIESLSQIYPTANWHERETYDFFGIDFKGHPDLRRIFLWEGFEGYPLRKDFKHPEIIARPY